MQNGIWIVAAELSVCVEFFGVFLIISWVNVI